ncbi:MAG: RluA family pseudouridine synthase [Lachnospiraceae bacterium]|nr:RluA family pseudouridine synthase [Lachnospiraceae bacterium]
MDFIYQILPEEEHQTVDQYLKKQGYSRRLIIQIKKEEKGILVNQNPVFTSHVLLSGDQLAIHLPEEPPSNIEPVPLPFPIIYEDDHILAINKPTDMPIHPSFQNYDNTLANSAAWYMKKQGLPFVFRCVNRLDRDTTGLVLLAKHQLSGSILSSMVKERKIHREYLAAVEGTIEKAGTISLPIGRLPGSAILRCIDPVHGESSITHYEPLAFCQGLTLLKIHLETGRTHQIRVHMNAIGHPLPGDYLYHPYFDVIKRQPLHSFQLSFSHPISGKSMELYAPVPEDIKKLFPSFFAETLAIKKESY